MKRLLVLIFILMLVLTSCDTIVDDVLSGEFFDRIINSGDTDAPATEPDAGEEDREEHVHDYEISATAPDCETGGYLTYTCNECGDVYALKAAEPLGHKYGSIEHEPTCEDGGYTTFICSSCGDSYSIEKTAPLGHSYENIVFEPTCAEGGYTTYVCVTCGDFYMGDFVEALSHTYGEAVVTAPTCEREGYSTYICVSCGYSYTADTVEPLGHKWQEATANAPKTCSVCFITEGEKLPEPPVQTLDTLYVSYINVGQGDSILIRVGDCDILIDAGTASYGTTVSNYLKNQGVDDIELMINTHPDADHCGGLTTVLNNFAVEEVWISKDTNKNTAAYKNFVAAITSEGLTAKKPNAGLVYTYEYLTLTVLYSDVGSDTNNSSIVVMLEYGSFKFLFTGDVGTEVENKLLKAGTDLSCDVLKVGHHGSRYSSSAAFLSATGADYGVICVGTGNSYGHPTTDALNRLSAAGIKVYRTDKNGHVVFSSDGNTLTLPSNDGTVQRSVDSAEALGSRSNTYYFAVKRITVADYVLTKRYSVI